MSNSFWIRPLGKALGSSARDVAKLIAEHGEVREGFLAKTGFETIYQSGEEQDGLSLALEALSGVDKGWLQANVDALIYVTSTGSRSAPGNGHLLHSELGLAPSTLVIDLNDACTGFLRSLILANSLLASESASNILVVISDTYSKLYNDNNLKVSPLFSDGASALLLSKAPSPTLGTSYPCRNWEILASKIVSDGGLANDLTISQGSAEFPFGELEMNGSGVFNFVVKHLRAAVNGVLSAAKIDLDLVDKWHIHQGSRAVVDAVSKSLGLNTDEQFVAASYGNVVGSVIPFQLMDDPPKPKTPYNLVSLLAFGVGMTMTSLIVKEIVDVP